MRIDLTGNLLARIERLEEQAASSDNLPAWSQKVDDRLHALEQKVRELGDRLEVREVDLNEAARVTIKQVQRDINLVLDRLAELRDKAEANARACVENYRLAAKALKALDAIGATRLDDLGLEYWCKQQAREFLLAYDQIAALSAVYDVDGKSAADALAELMMLAAKRREEVRGG